MALSMACWWQTQNKPRCCHSTRIPWILIPWIPIWILRMRHGTRRKYPKYYLSIQIAGTVFKCYRFCNSEFEPGTEGTTIYSFLFSLDSSFLIPILMSWSQTYEKGLAFKQSGRDWKKCTEWWPIHTYSALETDFRFFSNHFWKTKSKQKTHVITGY